MNASSANFMDMSGIASGCVPEYSISTRWKYKYPNWKVLINAYNQNKIFAH